ncbi:hypothetical protein NST41_32945 [Paenibacillus sp. FSL L8-0696]|uniref:hypothetical protein n=1 Tax=Paenibacillus TaxID=44249 RepID=UPI0015C3869A|nr:hypothetical protein [Paenibacillus odorifer]
MPNHGSGIDRKLLKGIHENITDPELKAYLLSKLGWEGYYIHNYGSLKGHRNNKLN